MGQWRLAIRFSLAGFETQFLKIKRKQMTLEAAMKWAEFEIGRLEEELHYNASKKFEQFWGKQRTSRAVAEFRDALAKCPWKRSTDPREIPNGYSEQAHCGLKRTIAEPGAFQSGLPMMACHEEPVGNEQPCVGWVLHQLNEGNNLALRVLAMDGRFRNLRADGPQHERFEDTLPKRKQGGSKRRGRAVPKKVGT